jgi:hypothetical protein
MSEQLDLIADPRWWQSYIPATIHDSPLYTQFYAHLPYDVELHPLLALIKKDQPVPSVFFSTVTFVLQSEPQHPLAAFYPYFHPNPRPAEEVYPVFHEFCLSHMETLRQILPTARLQTNEVTRCANLLPAFEMAFQRGGQKPLALVEIGTSAGLNLDWDQYGYDYGQGRLAGNASSSVQIHCAVEGELFPRLPGVMPPVASRLGVDIAPIDITNEDHVRWLRACIWPEEVYRFRLLDAAVAFARANPPKILAGDASLVLPAILEAIPADQTICLWHSYVLRQCPAEVRESIEQLLANFSQKRTLYRISLEFSQHDRHYQPQLELFTHDAGEVRHEHLANCNVHGERMEWLQSGL